VVRTAKGHKGTTLAADGGNTNHVIAMEQALVETEAQTPIISTVTGTIKRSDDQE
jgi:hypothetical protein